MSGLLPVFSSPAGADAAAAAAEAFTKQTGAKTRKDLRNLPFRYAAEVTAGLGLNPLQQSVALRRLSEECGKSAERSGVSFGPLRARGDSPVAQAVHALFDRLENDAPRYVSAVPSMLVSIIVMNVVVSIAASWAAADRRDHGASPDELLRHRWLAALVGAAILGYYAAAAAGNTWYKLDSLRANKQHFANVFWLGEYVKAMSSA